MTPNSQIRAGDATITVERETGRGYIINVAGPVHAMWGNAAYTQQRWARIPASGFYDVADTYMFSDEISRLAAAGITKGCNATGTMFCPDAYVTRGQMAAFLTRALHLGD